MALEGEEKASTTTVGPGRNGKEEGKEEEGGGKWKKKVEVEEGKGETDAAASSSTVRTNRRGRQRRRTGQVKDAAHHEGETNCLVDSLPFRPPLSSLLSCGIRGEEEAGDE